MTTINGVTFNMKTLEIVSTHRNVPNEEIGTDESFITDMGYTGLVLRMTGYEKTLAKYDEVVNEFMKPGVHALVHRTGWKFSIYSTRYVPLLDKGIVDNFFPYELVMLTSTPYRESTTETTRPKTITTNNQEWTADNSANDIETDGIVDAIPNIRITGGAPAATFNRASNYDSTNTDATEYTTGSTSWVLKKTYTFSLKSFLKYQLDTVGLDLRTSSVGSYAAYGKVSYQAASLNSGAETDIPGASWSNPNTGYESKSVTDLDIVCAGNETLTVRFYLRLQNTGETAYFKNLDCNVTSFKKDICTNPQIYNTADTTVKCSVGNEIEEDAEHLINTDGTGTITYADDFTTNKHLDAQWYMAGTTYDDPNNELDIGNDEYIIYKKDAKYPVTGVPVLLSTIDIITGTPTIQISIDGTTFYDIDTAIVDGVSTSYPLDNAVNLSLKAVGATEFYVKFNCDGSSSCSIETFALSVDIVTLDAEKPKIGATGVSTFRCDQDTNSGLNCLVSLIFRDRSWAI